LEIEFHASLDSPRLYLCGVLNRPRDADRASRHRIRDYNRGLDEIAGLRSTTKVVLFPHFPDFLFSDGLHLTGQGANRLADMLADALK